MYITNVMHFLDAKGVIGPRDGPAHERAVFLGEVIIAATGSGNDGTAPSCFECGGAVASYIDVDGIVAWACAKCGQAGRISDWQGPMLKSGVPAYWAILTWAIFGPYMGHGRTTGTHTTRPAAPICFVASFAEARALGATC